MKAQFINAKERKLELREVPGEGAGLKDMQEMVGGYIEPGFEVNVSDTYAKTVYVNEEGLLDKSIDWGFSIVLDGKEELYFVGNGCYVGFNPETGNTVALKAELETSEIKWLDADAVKKIRDKFNAGPAFMVLPIKR